MGLGDSLILCVCLFLMDSCNSLFLNSEFNPLSKVGEKTFAYCLHNFRVYEKYKLILRLTYLGRIKCEVNFGDLNYFSRKVVNVSELPNA